MQALPWACPSVLEAAGGAPSQQTLADCTIAARSKELQYFVITPASQQLREPTIMRAAARGAVAALQRRWQAAELVSRSLQQAQTLTTR